MTREFVYKPAYNKDRVILIADPDPTACEALSMILRLEGFEVFTVLDFDGLKFGLQTHRPNILISVFEIGGNDIYSFLKSATTPPGMLKILGMKDGNVERAVEAVHDGIHHVFSLPWNTEKLIGSLNIWTSSTVHVYGPAGSRKVTFTGIDQLTRRENEVAQHVLEGYSNKEIGRILSMSPRTVEVHRARIMQKMQARNTADLVRILMTI